MNRSNGYLLALSLSISLFYGLVVVYYPQLYIFATYEDLYGEWAQFFFFFATFIFSLLNVLEVKTGQYRWFFSLLALASFYTFMEEISWGQRLLDFASPAYFAEHSYQNEANLHNLLTGPVESWTKTLLTYLISIAFIGYGVLYPLFLKKKWQPAVFFNQWGVAPPPLALLPAFIVAAVCEMEFFSFNEAEVAELLVAMAMAFTAFHFYLQQKAYTDSTVVKGSILLTLSVFSLAYGVTELLLHQSAQRSEIHSRLANGYKKFADRYARYDHYAAIIEVLQLYDTLKPDNTVILRRIARQYDYLGQAEKAHEFLMKAIAVGLKRHTGEPKNVPTLISLAKSYHEIQRPEKVYEYAQQAYHIAYEKFLISNGNKQAYWAYWLAKSCEQLNRQPEALKYYRKAYKLMPSNRRYERAYYKKRHLMERYYAEDWTESLYTD